MIKVKPAKKTKGMLIYCHGTGKYVFRVYNPDYTFIDYDLVHSDLEVEILCDEACLYQSDSGNYLDHDPEVTRLDPSTYQLEQDQSSDVLELSERDYQALIDAGVNVPEPNEKLKKLMKLTNSSSDKESFDKLNNIYRPGDDNE
jgi:hypothetical protein